MKINKIIYEELQFSLRTSAQHTHPIRKKKPIKLRWGDGYTEYSIPVSKRIAPLRYVIHREDGPGIILNDGKKEWWWYDVEATNKKEWLDPNWRKRIEIRLFL